MVVELDDELVGVGVHVVGGLLRDGEVGGGVDAGGGSVVVVSSTGGGSGRCWGASARGLSGAWTVMTTVDVWPSVAARMAVLVVALTSACGLGGPASGFGSPVASIDASVAITVATTAPPAASSTSDETRRFGDS